MVGGLPSNLEWYAFGGVSNISLPVSRTFADMTHIDLTTVHSCEQARSQTGYFGD